MNIDESKFTWVDPLFNWCVDTIKDVGNTFGMTYNEINIVVFCILWPALLLYFMILAVLNTRYKSKMLKWVTLASVIITILIPIIVLVVI